MPPDGTHQITGQCYCGASRVVANTQPLTVAYCHCVDCRRVTGAPVAAFAAFPESAVKVTPNHPERAPLSEDVKRRSCPDCGTPLTARFTYLPDQVYVPLGILEQADALPPQVHCHTDKALDWLHISDDAARITGTARKTLNSK